MKNKKKAFATMVTSFCVMGILLLISIAIIDNANVRYGVILEHKHYDNTKHYYEIAIKNKKYFYSSTNYYEVGDTVNFE